MSDRRRIPTSWAEAKRLKLDSFAERLAAVGRELKTVSPKDGIKLQEVRQVLDDIGRDIELMNGARSDRARRRINAALAAWQLDRLPHEERPEWAKPAPVDEPVPRSEPVTLSYLENRFASLHALVNRHQKTEKLTRKELKQRLREKGWSVRDWATNANVDHHTANNYLRKGSKSYPSTRKKLADALGIPAESLP